MADGLRLALGYVLLALLVRAPALPFVELNWDEALYWRIAGDWAAGQLPYAAAWDRKPPLLFAVLAPFHWAGGGEVVALRLGTSLMVAATALALCAAGRSLAPERPVLGTLAGVAYILLSMRGAGGGTNAELVLAPFAVAGLALALAATHRQRVGMALLAGVLMGIAMLVKQVALAEAALAGLLGWLVPALRGLPVAAPALLRLGAAYAAGGVLPLAMVVATYAAAGQPGLLREVLAAAADAGKVPFSAAGLRGALMAYGLALAGALAGLGWLAWRGARVVAVAVAAWLAAAAAMLALLGRFADHMLIQALPPLALGLAALAVLAGEAMPRARRRVMVGAMVVLLGWSAAAPTNAAVEALWRRHMDGAAHWGDRTAAVAAWLRPRLQGEADLFVAGRMLGLYAATGMQPPTRFPFVMHLWSGYAPVDGAAEMARILAARPGFVVVDDLWLSGGPRSSALQAQVLELLHHALDEGYVMEARFGRFASWGGGFVGGGIGATVFRRADRREVVEERLFLRDEGPAALVCLPQEPVHG